MTKLIKNLFVNFWAFGRYLEIMTFLSSKFPQNSQKIIIAFYIKKLTIAYS